MKFSWNREIQISSYKFYKEFIKLHHIYVSLIWSRCKGGKNKKNLNYNPLYSTKKNLRSIKCEKKKTSISNDNPPKLGERRQEMASVAAAAAAFWVVFVAWKQWRIFHLLVLEDWDLNPRKVGFLLSWVPQILHPHVVITKLCYY